MNILETLAAQAARQALRPAHRVGDRMLTWDELWHRSGLLAGSLHAGREKSVVLFGHKEPEMLIGFLGAARAGIPYIPVDRSCPAGRLARIVASAGTGTVLRPEDVLRREGHRLAPPPMLEGPELPFYIMFTSGSTGEPKGVVITRGCLEAFLGWMVSEQRFGDGSETFLNQAVFSFDLSVMDTWCSLATGGTLVSLTADDVADYGRLRSALERSGITTWVSTPPFVQMCLGDRQFDAARLPTIRRFLFCGDVLTPAIARALLDRFPDAEVWNTYGPTEATVATTSVRIERKHVEGNAALPVGRPMTGTRVFPADASGHAVPPGSRGELIIEGPNVSPGYLGRPDLTAAAFESVAGVRRYRTGDEGSEADGVLFFHGRRDNMVKLAGYRIELGDVEAHLGRIPDIVAAVVMPGYREGRPESLHAFVVLRKPLEGESELAAGLRFRELLSELLPPYMLPRRFHVLDTLPLTANGKVDRAALAARLQA